MSDDAPTPEALSFGQLILPTFGRYAAQRQSPTTAVMRKVDSAYDVAALDHIARRASDAGENAFFAPAAFAIDKDVRAASAVQAIRAFWIDVDIAKSDASVATQLDALRWLDHLHYQHKLPVPTFVVSSGQGLHVWWALDVALPPAVWKAYAAQLKAFVVQHAPELAHDTSQWTNPAALLRWPDTLNYKYSPAQPVTIIRTASPVTLGELEAAIGAPKLTAVTQGNTAAAPTAVVPLRDRRKSLAAAMEANCHALRTHLARVRAGSETYDGWYSSIQLAAFTDLGIDAALRWSTGPKFNADAVHAKFNEYVASVNATGSAPVLCTTFCQKAGIDQAFACTGCKLFKDPHGTPVNVPQRIHTAPVAHATVARVDEVPNLLAGFVDYPPFLIPSSATLYPHNTAYYVHQLDSGSVVRNDPVADGSEQRYRGELFDRAWWFTHTELSPRDGSKFYCGIALPHKTSVYQRPDRFKIAGNQLARSVDIRKALSGVGVTVLAPGGLRIAGDALEEYLTLARKHLHDENRRHVSHLGWTPDGDFSVAGVVVSETGYQPYTPIAAVAQHNLDARGSTIAAHAALKEFLSIATPIGRTLFLTAFAAPIIPLLRVAAPTLALTGRTGVGKSLLARVMCDVWGTYALAAPHQDSTPKGVQLSRAANGPLPFIYEEAGLKDKSRLFAAVFASTDTGERVASSPDGQQGQVGAKGGLGVGVMLTNTPITELIARARFTVEREAALARIVEVHVDQPLWDNTRQYGCFAAFGDNPGILGLHFIRYVIQERAALTERAKFFHARAAANNGGARTEEARFVTAWIVACLVAAEALAACGLTTAYLDDKGSVDPLEAELLKLSASDSRTKSELAYDAAALLREALAVLEPHTEVHTEQTPGDFRVTTVAMSNRAVQVQMRKTLTGETVFFAACSAFRNALCTVTDDRGGLAAKRALREGINAGIVQHTLINGVVIEAVRLVSLSPANPAARCYELRFPR